MRSWEEVFDDLVRERGQRLVRYATMLTGSSREAEDLVQEALLRTFSRRSLRDVGAAEAYVRQSILTTWLDIQRRSTRWNARIHLVASDSSTPDQGGRSTQLLDLRAAIATLPPRQRACILLRYFEDMTVAETARQLALSEGSVKRYLWDAQRALEANLGPLYLADTEETSDEDFPEITLITPRGKS